MRVLKIAAAVLGAAVATVFVGAISVGVVRGFLQGFESSGQPVAAIAGMIGFILIVGMVAIYLVRRRQRWLERRQQGRSGFERDDLYLLIAGGILLALVAFGFVAQRVAG